MFAMTINK